MIFGLNLSIILGSIFTISRFNDIKRCKLTYKSFICVRKLFFIDDLIGNSKKHSSLMCRKRRLVISYDKKLQAFSRGLKFDQSEYRKFHPIQE